MPPPVLSRTAARNVGRQFKMWMPTMPMTMVSVKPVTAKNPTAYAIFRVLPKMTKHEIHEYLTKIYGLTNMIRKINTLNYDGKRKRFQSRAGTAYFKYKDFKKAVVYFDKSFRDFGLGTRVPELEEDMGDGEYDINEDNSMDVDIEPPAPVIEKGRSRPKRLS